MTYIDTPRGKVFIPGKKDPEGQRITNLSKMKILCYDLGLWTENCLRFVRDVAEVWYYVPDQEAFQEPFKGDIGQGLDGLERLDDRFQHSFWDYVDKADVIFIPDNTCSGMVEFLRRHNYPVAGVGRSERLETDRWYGRKKQRELGLPWHNCIRVVGITALRELCKNGKEGFPKEFYVKVDNEYRGIEESFPHRDYISSKQTIDRIEYRLGPYSEKIGFVCEEMLGGVEPGLDAITFEGDLLYPTMAGYEGKGVGIIERVYKDAFELPRAFKMVNDALSKEFKKNETKFFYSVEIKVDKDKIPYTLDLTLRKAGPGTAAIQSELIENYTEVVVGLALGVKVLPIINHKYAAACAFQSPEATKDWVNIQFPKDMRQWVKLRMACKEAGEYWAIPGFDSLGTVIGFGNTIDEAVNLVKDRMKEVHAKRIDPGIERFRELIESAEKGRANGVLF